MKKAQAAMEFLMTYGWAILVVLLAIAALAYFGVLNPGKYLPSSCTLPPGLGCTDFKVDADGVTLVIQNGMGLDLKNMSISVCGGLAEEGSTPGDVTLTDGEEDTFVITCIPPITDSKFKEDITITYTSESGLDHTMTGSISTQVE